MATLYSIDGDRIICQLCPHNCSLKKEQTGICRVRKNTGERIELLTYGVLSALALDPVEKKPLYHFYPGSMILSAGSYGCNMKCDFCQNYGISQNVPEIRNPTSTPEKLSFKALSTVGNIGLAFTYNEPVIWYEFVSDTARLIREKGMKTVLVSNGFINPEPLREMTDFIDAFNIDLKSFSPAFYKQLTGTRLEPVLETLRIIAASGRHLEITTLIIPGQNDNPDEISSEAEWISSELGKEVPLHISRYFPMNRRNDPPTSGETLERIAIIAGEILDYVYLGNISTGKWHDTKCPACGTIVTKRSGYNVDLTSLDASGNCLKCGKKIYKYLTLPGQ